MSGLEASSGYFRSGLPYSRQGRGPHPLVVFQGLGFENKPPPGWMVRQYRFLRDDYTVYAVDRKPGLPQGCTLEDMANDYAVMIREELGGPIDIVGLSTGGSIVQHFAADHADLVRRLVIHSSACTLSDSARASQVRVAEMVRQGEWRAAYSTVFRMLAPPGGAARPIARAVLSILAFLAAQRPPRDPSDLIVTIEAEDKFNFRERLAQIKAPTLVIAGTQDPFYSEALFRETAAGIPNARLILYQGVGHPAMGRRFGQDVLSFLKEGDLDSGAPLDY